MLCPNHALKRRNVHPGYSFDDTPAAKTSWCECRSQFPDDIQGVAEYHIRHLSQEIRLLKRRIDAILQNTHQHDVLLRHVKFLSRPVPVLMHSTHPIPSSAA